VDKVLRTDTTAARTVHSTHRQGTGLFNYFAACA
jgi:hypothetical protein